MRQMQGNPQVAALLISSGRKVVRGLKKRIEFVLAPFARNRRRQSRAGTKPGSTSEVLSFRMELVLRVDCSQVGCEKLWA